MRFFSSPRDSTPAHGAGDKGSPNNGSSRRSPLAASGEGDPSDSSLNWGSKPDPLRDSQDRDQPLTLTDLLPTFGPNGLARNFANYIVPVIQFLGATQEHWNRKESDKVSQLVATLGETLVTLRDYTCYADQPKQQFPLSRTAYRVDILVEGLREQGHLLVQQKGKLDFALLWKRVTEIFDHVYGVDERKIHLKPHEASFTLVFRAAWSIGLTQPP